MQIQLLIPGLLWPAPTLLGPASGLALDGLATLLGRGRWQVRAFEPYDRQLARLFGLDGETLALAALRRLGEADAAAPEPGSHWLCADPVNLSFAREHLLLNAFQPEDIAADEAATLIAALNDTFADLGRFEACAGNRWYLQLAAPTRCTSYPVHDVVGRPVKLFLPEGEDARLWQRTMNEAQILLHNHALNTSRSAAGRAPINSLWLWGAGTLQHSARAPMAAVQASDALGVGLARAAGLSPAAPDLAAASTQPTLVVLDELLRPSQQFDLEGWRNGLEALERDWFAPLAEALRRGRLDSLRLIAPGDRGTLELELSAAARWKFWRRPHPFNALLASLAPAARADHGQPQGSAPDDR